MFPNFLVVGAGGFIGEHLALALRIRYEKCRLQLAGLGVDKFSSISGIDVVPGFVDGELLAKCDVPDYIIYLAGGSSVGPSLREPHSDFCLTVPGLSLLLNKMRLEWKKSRLVYVSSAAVYGNAASASTSVAAPRRPVSPYGLHKFLCEELIGYYCREYDLDCMIIRPFSVYGPGLKKQLFWDVFQKMRVGDYSFFGSGQELRDWVYIDDLVEFILDISLSPSRGIVNAGTGIGRTVSSAIVEVFRAGGCTAKPHFSDSAKKGDPDSLVACYNEQICYSSLYRTSFEAGIDAYVRWAQGEE